MRVTISQPASAVPTRAPGTGAVILGYTDPMKTAISVPDETFEQAERQAAALGMSRSEFFSRAVQRYLEQLDAESLTGRINAAMELTGSDDSARSAVAAGRRRLADGDDW